MASGALTVDVAEEDDRRAPTARQHDVLRLIAEGKSNKEIARALGVSPATIKSHVTRAIAAVGALNRTDAAMRPRSRTDLKRHRSPTATPCAAQS